jgi:hypothetical protein
MFELFLWMNSHTDTAPYVQEIVLLSQLSHPNIVQYYSSDLVITKLLSSSVIASSVIHVQFHCLIYCVI